MKIIIATVQVPFIRGGAEIHAEELIRVLQEAGHEVEMVAVPLKGYPAQNLVDTMLACRLLDITESHGMSIDRVIGLKFPAYLIPHPRKVLWLLHQHREAYDLWGHQYCGLCRSPEGSAIRDMIINADNKTFAECSAIFANSPNVSKRLKAFNNVESKPLYHPPKNSHLFHYQSQEDYIFFPSRLNPIKRQELVLQSLTKTTNPVKVIFAGKSGDEFYNQHLISLATELGVTERVTFLGGITEEEKIKLYANSLGVIYPPLDEDYGYVTLEGMLSSKPIITCTDSGGPLEFVNHEETGLIVESIPTAIAAAMDNLWENRTWASHLGKAGRDYYTSLNISWSNVIENLLQ
jgi:glycosyltransferase involved in cell wall biosynthesis